MVKIDKGQWMDVDLNGNVTLVNKVELDEVYAECAELRKDNPSGMSKSKVWKHIARVPVEMLNENLDGLAFLHATPGSTEERVALNRFMFENQGFRTSEGKIARRIK